MTTLELLKEFLGAYFEEHNPEKGLATVTEDVRGFGFADNQDISGIADLRKMAATEAYTRFMAAELRIEREEKLSEDNAVLFYSLSLNSVTLHGRISGSSRQTPAGNRLYFINNAAINPLQTLNIFEDIAHSSRERLARELLVQAIPGGLMGGYMEPGFPFYFINDTMLQYLGYESEAEFVESIHGLIDNCFYGEDREPVNRAVEEQIAATGEYDVEYRMLKKDGSYIWIHDMGKRLVAEDGRDAILSVCYDITAEKEHERFLKGLVSSLNGDLALLAVDLKQKRTIPLYVSEHMGKQEGITKEEFLSHYGNNTMDSVYKGDYQRVWDVVSDAVLHDMSPSISFRILDGNGKYKWLNASFTKHGEKNGLPVILVLFTPSTLQSDLQLNTLSQNGIGIAAIDANTHELYFVNDAMFHMLGKEPCDYTGRLCSETLLGCGGSCTACRLQELQYKAELDQIIEINGKWLSFHGERCEWAGKSVVSIYAMDVTEKHQLQKQLEDVFENLPGAVCLYRWDGEKIYRLMVGQGFDDIFGSWARKQLEHSRHPLFEIVHSDDLVGLQNAIDEFFKDEENQTASYQYRVWNEEQQTYLWITTHAKKLKQSDGSVLIYAVYTNDTEQVMLKNNLADTRTAINAAVQYGRLGLWTYDLSSRAILQNLGGQGSYGYASELQLSPEILVSKKVIHEEDAGSYLHCYEKINEGAANSDCVVRIFDDNSKEYRFMHIYLVRRPDGPHTGSKAIGMSFDIHQEIKSCQALSAAQAQLKQEKQAIDELFENLPGGVVMYRWDGSELSPIYVSKGFSDLYGEDGYNVVKRGTKLNFDVVHPEDLPGLQQFILSHINKTGRFVTYRYRVWNKQQKNYIWIQLTGNVKHQPDGTSIAYANYANVDAEVKATEKIKAEEQLLERTCRLANIWMFYYNLQSKQLRLSKTLQEDFQVPATIENYPEGFLTYPVIPEEYRELYRQMVKKVDAGEEAITEMPVKLPGGSIRIVRFEWYATKEKDGRTIEIAGLPLDITKEVAERKRMENERQKLLGGDKQLTAYSITDLQKEIIIEARNYYLDSQFQTGDSCAAFNAKVVSLLLEEADRKRFLKMRDPKYAIRQYEAGITEWTADMRWKNGKGHIRWQRSVYSIVENSDTGTLYLYCYLYDVMDEKIAQDMFVGIQEKLYLKAGIISFASGQFYEYGNEGESRRLKITDYEEMRKAYIAANVLPEDARVELVQSSLENVQKELSSGEKSFSVIHRTRENGVIKHHQVIFAMVPQRKDACICVVRDITDLVMESEQRNQELQKALTAANAAAKAKSEFLSRMSHEIRTPMNAIMGMTAIAQDNKSDYLQVYDCLSKIESSSQYLLTLINDILEMSRIESGNLKLSEDSFDLAEMLEQIRVVAEPIAKKSEIRLEIVNRTQNGVYYGDSIRIQQVMINLLGNALKFTKRSGRVRFVISAKEETKTNTTFEFMVEDTGIGMSEQFMRNMFDAFAQEDSTTTSQYGGSGLGLAISKSLVDAMGGTITAESMVGIGTSFTVRIPLKKVQSDLLLRVENKDEIPQAEQDAILKGKRILMAEDHPMNVMIAKKLLERKGLQITVAENGKIAVETFNSSEPNEYAAILMDIRMPVMDGLEATRQIRALDRPDAKEIPIIAMTANALEEDRRNSRAAGMNEHLAKPIDPKRMYQALARQLRRRKV